MIEILSYPFMRRALLVGFFLAISCAGLGIFLVLRRFSMIGDGLAHVGFAAVAIGLMLGAVPIMVAIPLVMLSSLWILRLGEKTMLYGDSAIALVSSLAVAAGVLLASIGKGFSVDLMSYLFGSILSIRPEEVWLAVLLSIFVMILLRFFYWDLFAVTYDEDFARISGIRAVRLNRILVMLTGLTVTLGIRMVGSLLISSLIIFPAVTALQLSLGFRNTVFLAMLSATVSVVLGVFVSFFLNLPTGATIVFMNFLMFCVAFAAGRLSRRTS